jgi:hypothetical protein
MNAAFDSCFKSSAKLVDSAGLLGFIAGNKKNWPLLPCILATAESLLIASQ